MCISPFVHLTLLFLLSEAECILLTHSVRNIMRGAEQEALTLRLCISQLCQGQLGLTAAGAFGEFNCRRTKIHLCLAVHTHWKKYKQIHTQNTHSVLNLHMQIHSLCSTNSSGIQAMNVQACTHTYTTTGGVHKPWCTHKYIHSHAVSYQASYQLGCQAIILAWGAKEKCKCSSLSKSKVSQQSWGQFVKIEALTHWNVFMEERGEWERED